MRCRHCARELRQSFIDLGTCPPSNAYLSETDLNQPERYYPLHVFVCANCWLVQTEDFVGAEELFGRDYAYFTSTSTTALKHAEAYVEAMVQRLALGPRSSVVEVAANDGYLLQYVRAREIPCYGIEPTESTATAARAKGIEIIQEFFGQNLARRLVELGRQADLLVANNVLAHVPDINDFVGGCAMLLKDNGVATFEFPHLLQLVEHCQFDTIYHEHYSYLSLTAVDRIVSANGLKIFDVEELPTHGGSLRVFVQPAGTGKPGLEPSVGSMLAREQNAGLKTAAFYGGFQETADKIKEAFSSFLLDAKARKLKVAGYGAAAKGNTLINYAGVQRDLLPFIVDRAPAKQGKFTPGSRIPIVDEMHLKAARPDRIVILPWNLVDEISAQLQYTREWGARFVCAIPALSEF